jgi:hypothetical protein
LLGLVPFKFEPIDPFETGNAIGFAIKEEPNFRLSFEAAGEFDGHFFACFAVNFCVEVFPGMVDDDFGRVLFGGGFDDDEVTFVLNHDQFGFGCGVLVFFGLRKTLLDVAVVDFVVLPYFPLLLDFAVLLGV